MPKVHERRLPQPRLVLAMLLLVYTFNFIDRQMLGILAGPIKADLRLSDTQFGAIGGLAFALLYSLLGVPLAYLADRTSRSGVIAGALAAWSLFTALCGFAAGYWQLFAARLGVGCGEAGGVAPSYALIADCFPPERRARAIAVFALGIPVGTATGLLLGAYIAALVDWRAAFVTMGAAGLILAPVFRLLVRDPPRGRSPAARPGAGEALAMLARSRAFWLLSLAAACSSTCGYGLALWIPSVLMRSFGLGLISTAQFVASGLLLGGTIGVLGSGWLADRLGQRDRGGYARLPMIAWLISAPTLLAGLSAPGPVLAWIILLVPNALNIAWMAPVVTAIQHLVPPRLRATASGGFLLINNLIGLGLGPLLMGFLSDRLTARFGADALRLSAISCLSLYLLAAALVALAIRPLRAQWIDDPGPQGDGRPPDQQSPSQ